MGVFAYCQGCDQGFTPTLKDKLVGQYVCQCGEIRELDVWDRGWAIDEVLERLETVETKIEEILTPREEGIDLGYNQS